MDTEEFKQTFLPELALVMSDRQGTIPEPQPLDISEWLAMSMLQKSIRRGETGHALRAAATLLLKAPHRLWRRLVVAVFEDVGLGALDLIAPVLLATSGKTVRQKFGGDWAVASAIVERMAAARKCRSADDLLMTLIAHPLYENDRLNLTYHPLPELMATVAGGDDIVTRAIALFYATGTDRCPVPTMRMRKGNLGYVQDKMLETGFPHCVLELAQRGSTRMREPLPIFVALLSSDVPPRSAGYEPTEMDDEISPITMLGDVPSYAVDYYVREGRAALKAFLKRNTDTGRWIRDNVAQPRWAEFLGGLVLRLDGLLMRRRLQWPVGQRLRQMMDVEANGCGIGDATEVLALLQQDLNILNEERRNVL